ncbi:MAG TPA: aldolase [Allosphingosinicella sp.]|jgi:serine kinase of HPr protein (carbohydrate metabolism regulator)
MTETIHASCAAIDRRGMLISGASGRGKSDLLLRLLDRGAVLVSDDYTCLAAQDGRLLASPPQNIAGRIEVRGVGIVGRPFVEAVPIALLIDLDAAPERLPECRTTTLIGISVPVIALSALEPSAPIKVEAALHLHGLAFP